MKIERFALKSTVNTFAVIVGATFFLCSAFGSALASRPMLRELPQKVVATVLHAPTSLVAITHSDLMRTITQVAIQDHVREIPKTGERGYEKLKFDALGDLLDERWIEGQAAEMGLIVTQRQVALQLAQIKRKNFKNTASYTRYLHRMHLTQRDVKEKIRLQILSQGIRALVVKGISGKKARERALSRFTAQYDERWRARTLCAPGYVFDRCSNGPLPRNFGRLF